MLRFVLVSCTLTAVLLLIALPVSAECSKCTGKSRDHIYQGGGQSPLSWYSLQRLEHPGNQSGSPPIYCYEQKVQNHSDREVADIYWPVAGYQRDLLPPQSADCCCQPTSIPGHLKYPHPMGLLYYGPGSASSYPTTTYAPKEGWPVFTKMSAGPQYPSLTAALQFAVRTREGKLVVSNVGLLSTVFQSPVEEKYVYLYEFQNDGPEPLFIFWNIPQTDEFRKQFPMDIKKPLPLPPDDRVFRIVISEQIPAWAHTTVLVFNIERKVIARGTAAGFVFEKGEIIKNPLLEWETPERR